MDGPITCEQLRNICKMYHDNELKKYIESEVSRIKNEVIQCAYHQQARTCARPAGMVFDMKNMYKVQPKYKQLEPSLGITASLVFDLVLEGLKEVFPDMKIMADPLKTYILLDWS